MRVKHLPCSGRLRSTMTTVVGKSQSGLGLFQGYSSLQEIVKRASPYRSTFESTPGRTHIRTSRVPPRFGSLTHVIASRQIKKSRGGAYPEPQHRLHDQTGGRIPA